MGCQGGQEAVVHSHHGVGLWARLGGPPGEGANGEATAAQVGGKSSPTSR
jgi:hypothetical protein